MTEAAPSSQPRRTAAGVLVMVVLVAMGEHLAERFLPIYLLALGAGAIGVGALNAMDNLLSALMSFPGGYLADRFGMKRTLLWINLAAMIGYGIVLAIPSWPAVLAGAVLFIAWSAISLPATLNLIYTVMPKTQRTMGVSLHSLVRRIPMALGPLIGGWCIARWGETEGMRLAFAGSFVLAGVAIVVQEWLIVGDSAEARAGAQAEGNPLRLWGTMPPILRQLLVSDVLIRFCEQIPYAFVVVWCMKMIAEPVDAFEFGLLTALEYTTAALIYLPVARLADRGAKKPFVLLTFVFFTVFPLILMNSHSFEMLGFAFFVRGLKEFGEPTRKALIMDLSPAACRAGMFGLYYLVRDVIVSVAVIGGAFLWREDPALNLWVAFGFGVLGTAWFAVFGKDTNPPLTLPSQEAVHRG